MAERRKAAWFFVGAACLYVALVTLYWEPAPVPKPLPPPPPQTTVAESLTLNQLSRGLDGASTLMLIAYSVCHLLFSAAAPVISPVARLLASTLGG